jgi:uncharacterized membrane protein YukC
MTTENVDSIIPKGAVSESKSETEAVTISRHKHETIRFVVVAIATCLVIVPTIIFLFIQYGTSDADIKGKIIVGLISALSASLGVFIGKRI